MSEQVGTCDYCGTSLDEDGNCAASGERHYDSTCREYVYAALRSYKADLARVTAELAEALQKSDAWKESAAKQFARTEAMKADRDMWKSCHAVEVAALAAERARCHACAIETEHGTEDEPHPIGREYHSCVGRRPADATGGGT